MTDCPTDEWSRCLEKTQIKALHHHGDGVVRRVILTMTGNSLAMRQAQQVGEQQVDLVGHV